MSPADLLTAVTMPGPDRKARSWLDRDVSRLGKVEPYDWGGVDPYTLGEPVRVGADGELVMGGEADAYAAVLTGEAQHSGYASDVFHWIDAHCEPLPSCD